ncbi:hypothetical protein VNI00_010563 [Paramarasmius palmivorus]|uniref:Uncharacterized protein n=1 Tax=Paramarasmius palmivorus TaxID=297713 RepID=A0AAW0CJ09_9AGAR
MLCHDYSPYVPARSRGSAGRKVLRRTFIGTTCFQYFTVIYVEQGARNRLPVNEYVTFRVDGMQSVVGKPWLGPILVDFEGADGLTVENMLNKANLFLEYLHIFDDFLRVSGIIPPQLRIKWGYRDDACSVSGGEVQSSLLTAGDLSMEDVDALLGDQSLCMTVTSGNSS